MNTLKIFLKFNNKKKIALLLIIAIFLSVSEAIGFMILSPFFSFLVNFNESFLSETNNLIVINFINFFEISDKYSFLKSYIFFILFFYLFKFLFTVASIIFNANFIYEFRNKVQNKVLTFFLDRSYEFHLSKNSTEKVRFSSDEITNYFNLVIVPSILLFAEIFIILSLIIFAFFYSKNFFFIFIIFAALCGLMLKIIRNFLKKIGNIRLRTDLKRHQILQQIFFGIKDIIIFSKKEKLIDENKKFTKIISKSDKKYLIFESLPRYIIEIFIIFGSCTVFYFFYSENTISFQEIFPKLAIYTLIFFRILPSFTRIARGVSAMSYAKEIEHNLIEFIFDEKIKVKNFEYYEFNETINIQYIDYKYPDNNKMITYDQEILIKKGNFICLVGETGVGKTTLFDLLSGLIIPNNSLIYIDGKLIKNNQFRINQRMGIVHQNIFLFNDTLLNNITFFDDKEIDYDFINKILKIVILEDFLKALPNGLNTNIGEIGNKISGGQKQRIAIARAIYQNPEFLLFDEATSALDHQTEEKLLRNLKNYLNGKATFILISHKTTNKEIFDNIIKIKK